MKKHRINSVEPGSIAQELGIETGDCLVSVDGLAVLDVLDYRFRTSAQHVQAQFMSQSGQTLTADIEKEAGEDLGLDFEMPLMDQKRRCMNRCVFCFVDQLPQNVRSTLRFKDDDYRLSFLQGNFVTLTNVKQDELKRIVDQRISPINISVHTTDGELRARMLQNKRAALINEQLETLVAGDISFYAQIVVCPGLNDREALTKTLEDLSKYRPNAKGVAVVPVGLTKYRDGLSELHPVLKTDATDVIERVNTFMQSQQSGFVYLADEFYLKADRMLPEAKWYGDFAQIEDGVGMLRHLIDGFEAALAETATHKSQTPRSLSIATGEAASPFILELCQKAQQKTGDTGTCPFC